MTFDISRRGFIAGALAFGGMAGCLTRFADNGKRWYKGNLHMHTFWSDGKAFPEEAVLWYKEHGYNFIGISDHNVFQQDPDRWVACDGPGGKRGKVGAKYAEKYLKAFPDAPKRKDKDGRTLIRLKTFGELAKAYGEAGEFLLVPNVEATRKTTLGNGREHRLHMNYVNLPELLPSYREKGFNASVKGKTVSGFLGEHLSETEALARKTGSPHLFILNHPIWTWYDVGPEAFIDNPGVRFFELCNNGSPYAPGEGLPSDGFDTDRLWDVVNAFRARRGQPLLYGIGTDDTHYYCGEESRMLMPGNAWSLVRAPALTADDLIAAMLEGDFVTCEMLEPEDVWFDRGAGRLSVSVAAKAGVARTIKFIVTKKDFSEKPVRTVTVKPAEKKNLAAFERTIAIYDGKIGMTAKTTKGAPGEALVASYTLGPDDLYVRARIEESGAPLCTAHLHPQGKHVAWTQPYTR